MLFFFFHSSSFPCSNSQIVSHFKTCRPDLLKIQHHRERTELLKIQQDRERTEVLKIQQDRERTELLKITEISRGGDGGGGGDAPTGTGWRNCGIHGDTGSGRSNGSGCNSV